MGQLKRGQLREADMVEAIRDYLISMTAKDCSIMITMLPAEQQDSKPPHMCIYTQPPPSGCCCCCSPQPGGSIHP